MAGHLNNLLILWQRPNAFTKYFPFSFLLFPFTSSQACPYPTWIATSTPISWVSRFLCSFLCSLNHTKGRKFSALFLEGVHQQLLDLKAWAHTRSEMGVDPVELFDCLSFNSLLPKRNEDLLQWYIISIRWYGLWLRGEYRRRIWIWSPCCRRKLFKPVVCFRFKTAYEKCINPYKNFH